MSCNFGPKSYFWFQIELALQIKLAIHESARVRNITRKTVIQLHLNELVNKAFER